MINSVETITKLRIINPIVFFFQFLFVLALIIIVFFSDNIYPTPYFQEEYRVSFNQLTHSKDLVVTPDHRYYLVATDGKNSTIQVYQQGKWLELELVSTTNRDYVGHQLNGLSKLLTLEENKVYGISESYRKNTYGCLLSFYDIKSNGTLTPLSELFISSSNSPPFHKCLTGTKNYIFLNCQRTLVSVEVDFLNGNLIQKDTLLLAKPGIYPEALIYFEQLQVLFISFFSNDKITNQQNITHAYINQNGKLLDHEGISYPTGGSFCSAASLALPKYLWVYAYLFHSNSGIIFSFNAELFGTKEPVVMNLGGLKIVNFIPGKKNLRLFYISEANQFYRAGRLGAVGVDIEGKTVSVTDADSITGNYQKLILTNNSCQLLALTKTDNINESDSLILYRINDFAIGCGTAKINSLAEIVGITATGLSFLTITAGLSAAYWCYRIRKRGANKGYIPIGEPEY